MIQYREKLTNDSSGIAPAPGSYAEAKMVRAKAWSILISGAFKTLPILLLVLLSSFLVPIGDPFDEDWSAWAFCFWTIPTCTFGFAFALGNWMLWLGKIEMPTSTVAAAGAAFSGTSIVFVAVFWKIGVFPIPYSLVRSMPC